MGAIGMGAAANARPDGYTVGMITFQLSTYRLMGLADLSYRNYSLIQLVNQSPASISVGADQLRPQSRLIETWSLPGVVVS